MRSVTLFAILASGCSLVEPEGAGLEVRGKREHQMANCPSAVPTARTTVRTLEDGVELLVTAREPHAQEDIRELAREHTRMGDPRSVVPEHTGMHGGPGTIGHCPIIHDDTIVTAVAVVDGVRIQVRARRSERIGALQRETLARAKRLTRMHP
jgi:TusA-related sulfurtransferase